MSAVSTAASASMSNVRQAAARTPGGQEMGPGGTVLLASPAPGGDGSTGFTGGSSALRVAGDGTGWRRSELSDLGADFPRRLILRYEGDLFQTRPARSPDVDHGP